MIMETNNIIYTIDKDNRFVNCVVKVRLNDECKNGHQDFSLTATFWKIGRKRIDKNVLTAGCCHKEILKHFPELKIFSVLHLFGYRDWETDRKSTRLNSSHSAKSRMPSSA